MEDLIVLVRIFAADSLSIGWADFDLGSLHIIQDCFSLKNTTTAIDRLQYQAVIIKQHDTIFQI